MDEFHLDCPGCGARNTLFSQDVPVRTPITCSSCGSYLGDVRDFIEREQVDAPPLATPESDRTR